MLCSNAAQKQACVLHMATYQTFIDVSAPFSSCQLPARGPLSDAAPLRQPACSC